MQVIFKINFEIFNPFSVQEQIKAVYSDNFIISYLLLKCCFRVTYGPQMCCRRLIAICDSKSELNELLVQINILKKVKLLLFITCYHSFNFLHKPVFYLCYIHQ